MCASVHHVWFKGDANVEGCIIKGKQCATSYLVF